MKNVIGDRDIVIARELTKIHEEFLRGNINELIEKTENIKGEMVLIIDKNNNVDIEKESLFNNLTLEEHYKLYEKQGLCKKDIIKKIAKDRNVNKNEIYQKFID